MHKSHAVFTKGHNCIENAVHFLYTIFATRVAIWYDGILRNVHNIPN